MSIRFNWFILFFCFILSSCVESNPTPKIDKAYQKEIHTWRQKRIKGLQEPNSWLSLAGLFWLKEGENTIGSASDNDFVFPEKAAAKIGVLILEGDSVYLKVTPGVEITYEGQPVKEIGMAYKKEATTVYHQSLNWNVLRRNEKIGIRLRDTLSEVRQNFSHIENYPINQEWELVGNFVPFDPPRTLAVKNVLDMEIDQTIEGTIYFEKDGEMHSLITLDGGRPDQFFMIFADATTGDETYGGGRYLYIPRPTAKGKTIIDFNKAYNPPCVFTPFATCLLPPSENRLDLAIRAGEKNYGDH